MTYILCIETATTNCSVALSVNGSVIALREDNSKEYSHAERLHVFIEEVLAEAQVPKPKLNAIAVSKGPGSYTGLRIGVSAAKGLCFALDIPLLAIPTLQSLAAQGSSGHDFIIPMLDARRMEVYSAVYNSQGEEIREVRAEVLEADLYQEYLDKGRTLFLGSGAAKYQTICSHGNAHFYTGAMPSATQMVPLAHALFKIDNTVNVAYFEPFYLKDFISK